jgi:hypothetical protein
VRHETGSGTAVRTGSGSGNTVHDKNGGSAPAKIQPQDAGQAARTASG